MQMTRREFLASSAALAACPLLAADGKPLLKVGVLSDIHVEEEKSARRFEDALRAFAGRNVDAVALSGDLTQFGFVEELMLVRDAWERVFPKGLRPDGQPVARLFIYGNHDYEGPLYWNKIGERRYPDPVERAKHVIVANPKAAWERVFRETYEPIWIKTVKGFRFVGANWDNHYDGVRGTAEFLSRHRDELKSSQPFFWLAHQHPKDTCHGVEPDDGRSTRALSEFPNAIALTGHSHFALTDERLIWQGAFTSVNASSLFTAEYLPDVEGIPEGYENGVTPRQAKEKDGEKLSPRLSVKDAPQGMVMSVFSDRTVFERVDFLTGLPLGANWTVPHSNARPYSPDVRARSSEAPKFGAGSVLRIRETRAKNRAGETKDVYEVVFPPAVGGRGLRAFSYEVCVLARGSGRALAKKRVLAPGFNRPVRLASGGECRFDREALPGRDELAFEVRPLNCFGKKGKALTCQ